MKQRLRDAPELLDEQEHDQAELVQSLEHVAQVNRLLGGRRAVLRSLPALLQPHRTTRILDVGTGSADIPLAIAAWARHHRHDIRIHATDRHPQMRAIARTRTAHETTITVGAADALALPYRARAFDIVLLSLTLHHFEERDQITALREAARVAARAVVVNELERNQANYYGSRLLALTHWRGNRLTRHDGPLSVLRAFTMHELRTLAQRAELRVEHLRRRFFYRLVLIADTRVQ